ncbi:MAG: hypothetical protein WKG07_13430 [Hymenobacter sp.]
MLASLAGPAAARAAPAPPDSLRPPPVFDRRRLVVQIDSRYSIINGHLVPLNGLKLGLEFPGPSACWGCFLFSEPPHPYPHPLPPTTPPTRPTLPYASTTSPSTANIF